MLKITKDGRTILTGRDYTAFRYKLWKSQRGNCKECGRVTSITADLESDWSFHVDHKAGRGMGGSRRDDTFEACQGLCGLHHREKHNQGRSGSKRISGHTS